MLNALPAAMPTTLLPGPRPLTCTGWLWSVGRVPSPSWPDLLLPHETTEPSDFNARLCEPPAAIATTPLPLPSPMTCAGAERLLF